jgi:hypothetical protein
VTSSHHMRTERLRISVLSDGTIDCQRLPRGVSIDSITAPNLGSASAAEASTMSSVRFSPSMRVMPRDVKLPA